MQSSDTFNAGVFTDRAAQVSSHVVLLFLTEYFFLEPNFHNPEPDEIVLAESDNEFLRCNATTSGNADLQWMWNGNGSVIPIQVIYGTSPSNISDSVLTEMCRELSPTAEGGVFSISLGRTEVRHYISNSVATVLLQQLGLFLCRVQANNSGSYFCAASNSARESPHVQIIVEKSTPPVVPGQQDIYIIIGVVSVTAVALLAIVILACGYLRYRSLKSEALPMSPMETFPLHSYSNPALLQLVASRQDPLEFPRERLTFTRVLGGWGWGGYIKGAVGEGYIKGAVGEGYIKGAVGGVASGELWGRLTCLQLLGGWGQGRGGEFASGEALLHMSAKVVGGWGTDIPY